MLKKQNNLDCSTQPVTITGGLMAVLWSLVAYPLFEACVILLFLKKILIYIKTHILPVLKRP